MKAASLPIETRLSRILELKSPSSPIFSSSSCRLCAFLRMRRLAERRSELKIWRDVSSTMVPTRSRWSAARSTTASSRLISTPQPDIEVVCGFIARRT